ncbi:MAG: asparagine synthase (glutamine-hydrolyzing) [Anaerolineae bacterium]|nr:asparagine synthase (glutamine-hydrolyzing) [Anaerolineae bacterium]
MCGICGAVHFDGKVMTESLLRQMNESLVHRGPDGDGFYCGENMGLAMRRLSIIDLAGSDQPLYNEDKSIAVVFNGEIYNYRQLRHDLAQQGHTFHTDGDGETIAHLYEQYGTDAPQHMRGQFAFALWDNNEKCLFLARDRFGQKPLYYYHDNNIFVFGSEIKALLNHPSVPRESAFDDSHMLALYLGYGTIPAPMTAFKGIKMLEPQHTLTVDYHRGALQTLLQSQAYWEIPSITDRRFRPTDNIQDYIDGLREILRESVELRMIADVPLGAFLSGGLDSSLIVALMQQVTTQQVKTFSIGFEGDDSFDETPYAKQVADTLHTDHTPFIVKPDAMGLLEKLVWHHDQPFADSSAIPTFLVSELTRQHVTVALTGDGGDEMFAGYERFYAANLFKRLQVLPHSLWQGINALVGLLPEGTSYRSLTKRAARFTQAATKSPVMAYFDLVRLLSADQIHELLGTTDSAAEHFQQQVRDGKLASILEGNMQTYLPDDLLIKADRCIMAASLEARAPFLDHKLAEFAADIPMDLKLKGSTTKYILKEAARGLLPDSIIDRKKTRFRYAARGMVTQRYFACQRYFAE